MKELVITIKIPIPEMGGKIAEKIIIQATKAMFPKDKLPHGSTVEYAVKEKH